MMQVARLVLVLISVALACVVASASAATRAYDISPLESPPGYDASYPSGVNSAGAVVGTAVDLLTGATAAVVWRETTVSELGTLGGSSSGVAVNDAGLVVGSAETVSAAHEVHAFVWDGEEMRDLGVPGHESGASAVNAAGLIVGYERDSVGNVHAMLWDRGVGHRVDRFETGFSEAIALNDAGQVLITAFVSGPGGTPQTYVSEQGALSFVGAFQATALDGSGRVIGYEATPLPDLQGLLWDGATRRELGDRYTPLLPVSINDRGQIVGSIVTDAGAEHAAIWEDGSILDLNDAVTAASGWELWRATAINTGGQIAGYGTFQGAQRAFLLTSTATAGIPR